MKKAHVPVVVVVMLAMVLMGSSGFAGEKRFAVGVKAVYSSYQGGDIDLFAVTDTDYENVVGVSADLTCFFGQSFSLELGLGRQETTMKYGDFFGAGDYGELTQIPILLTGRYHFTPSDKTNLYVGLGIGYYLNDMTRADGPGDYFDGAPPGVKAFADDAAGYHVNAGIECFLSEHVALNMDLKYVMLDADIGFKGAGYNMKDSTSLNTFTTGIGVKYYF